MGISAELYEFIIKVVDERVREIKVTREEFDRLVRTVRELAEKIDQLAEAQRRTEERLNKLAEAQRRTEERLNELAKRVDQLAEAQRRTEERLNKLVEAMDLLRREVGRLSDTIGFGLEDIARVVLPGWLYRHLGVEVDELERRFIEVDGGEIEVNLYGEGVRNGEKIVVVGECKSRIYGRDVEQFYRRVYRVVSRVVKTKTIGILFGYLVHPSAQKKAEELGLYVVASYQR